MPEARAVRWLYSLALYLALPWVVFHLLFRSAKQPEYRRFWSERFALYGTRRAGVPESSGQRTLWVHCVSVGETRGAQTLVEALLTHYPGLRVVMTHMTPTGRAVSEELFGSRIDHAYLPYDFPGAVRRFLRRFNPVLGILLETELWPNFLAGAARRGVPMALVNARLSEKSLSQMLRFRALARPALCGLDLILAQTPGDARRLERAGAPRVTVSGNLKFDVEPPPGQLALGQMFRRLIGVRSVLLCASTREGEESLLLAALAGASLPESVLVVLVPRHPQRFGDVENLIRNSGFRLQRRSDGELVDPLTQIWLGDTMGEMFAYYAAADVAYVGGGLLPYGTHNLIEASAVGCPVLLGPYTFNFEQAAGDAIASGAAVRVKDAAALVQCAMSLLVRPAERERMGLQARLFSSQHRGATTATLQALVPLLAGCESNLNAAAGRSSAEDPGP